MGISWARASRGAIGLGQRHDATLVGGLHSFEKIGAGAAHIALRRSRPPRVTAIP